MPVLLPSASRNRLTHAKTPTALVTAASQATMNPSAVLVETRKLRSEGPASRTFCGACSPRERSVGELSVWDTQTMIETTLTLFTGTAALRRATRNDLPAILGLLADDPISVSRGDADRAEDRPAYERAFAAIDKDPSPTAACGDVDRGRGDWHDATHSHSRTCPGRFFPFTDRGCPGSRRS